MSQLFRNTGVGKKVILFTLPMVAAVMASLIFFISHSASDLLEEDMTKAIHNEAAAVRNMIEMFDRASMSNVARFYKNLASEFPAAFSLDAARQIEVGGTAAPVLKNGETELNLNFAVVDDFFSRTGVTATVFVKKGEDFVRITTSVKKEDGQRAVGTSLDRKHPAYPLMLSGQGYRGVVTLFGKPFATEY